MSAYDAFYDLIVLHNFKRGPVLEELRRQRPLTPQEEEGVYHYTYDETGADVNLIEEALSRVKKAREENEYFISYAPEGTFNLGTFSTSPLFDTPRLNIEREILASWASNPFAFSPINQAIPLQLGFYVCFFSESILYHFDRASAKLYAQVDDDFHHQFHEEYFNFRRDEKVGEMRVKVHRVSDILEYFYEDLDGSAVTASLIVPYAQEEAFEPEPEEDPTPQLPIDCEVLLRTPDFYRIYYPALDPVAIGPVPDALTTINDAAYVENPEVFSTFTRNNQHVVIMSPFEPGRMWRGAFFAKDDLRNWMTNPNNIVYRCQGRQYPIYEEGLRAIFYLRLEIAGVTYYVPYIDLEDFCRNDEPAKYMLQPTELQITYVASLSVMRGAWYTSSQHCTDETPKRIYRLRKLI